MKGKKGNKKQYKCCICKNKFKGWGNNPWPLYNEETSLCCNYCNEMYVIPARIKLAYMKGNENGKSNF